MKFGVLGNGKGKLRAIKHTLIFLIIILTSYVFTIISYIGRKPPPNYLTLSGTYFMCFMIYGNIWKVNESERNFVAVLMCFMYTNIV